MSASVVGGATDGVGLVVPSDDAWADVLDDDRLHRPARIVVDVDPVLTFADLLAKPPWMSDALCAEYRDPVWFVDGRAGADVIDDLRLVCANCVVSDECLDYALDKGEHLFGYWAGTTRWERVQMRRKAKAA